MRFPNSLSPETFLAGYWQKRPLFMPGALEKIQPSLISSDLAWLATQEDVESRLVMTRHDGEATRYEVLQGPFRDEDLSSLPPQNWSLLVQDVEKHLPDFRELLVVADFIPDWRIDDLMVSYAAPGGSVGPHMDNYDVFLLQGEGSREWRLGNGDDVIQDASCGDLSLLQPFADPRPETTTEGDILYLPPGVPHWGIARDYCMTYSIGMRAPSVAELNGARARLYENGDCVRADSSQTGSGVFYEDPDLTVDEAVPGLISDAARCRTKNLLCDSLPVDDARIATALGVAVTDPKAWLAPECISEDEANALIDVLEQDESLSVHGMARLAFFRCGESDLIFANGYSREESRAGARLFYDICKYRSAPCGELCANEAAGLARWLLAKGVFDLTGLPD